MSPRSLGYGDEVLDDYGERGSRPCGRAAVPPLGLRADLPVCDQAAAWDTHVTAA